MLNDVPGVKDAITTPDGDIYSLPQVNDCYHCSMSEKMWVYKPWLDKLGLKIPTTTDEFTAMLKAFKTQDPNGNGKADEIPLSGMKNSWHEDIAGFLMNPFIYSDMFVKDGKIQVPYNTPEWQEGLKYLHQLYADGLIYSGSFTQDSEQFMKLGENPGTPILGVAVAATRSTFADISDKGRGNDYVVVPPLKGPDGNRVTLYEPAPVTQPAEFIITKNCKHPDVAMRWADAMYKRDITLRSVIGRPDKEWRNAKEGETGLNGKQASWVELKQSEALTNHAWMQTGPSLRTREFRSSHAVPKGTQEEVLWKATEQYEPYLPKDIEPVPDLFFTEEQSNEMATLEKTVTDYVDEMKAKFITGKANIDKDWDKYIKTLDSMGIKDYVKIYQEAYDAKYKN
ncbi:putative aldouronate transport system substrate-binding protein [Pullulanibacillus pueri]|uniref:ABC transporter substrate-binding protein n=1 Tax=Pullulanibacillus pueri TaxID=1437324 RepID=A0A8J2ZWE7_9BACL|nr:extracellular solute-binding protein [Pullulanibacillus pueri]MBM7680917.1 putative aldouronate transport system substrate-binding protein [Pullulanibacillus pueri]GGH81326.1 hypothetical protein GCM10007096_19060 [Pullulanibacillus pueri]